MSHPEAITAWTATPDDWKQRLGDAITIARELKDELDLDELEYADVRSAALEAIRHHGILTVQPEIIGAVRLPPGARR